MMWTALKSSLYTRARARKTQTALWAERVQQRYILMESVPLFHVYIKVAYITIMVCRGM